MSQYADGGIMATKPYVSSGQYINGMSNYCKSCYYSVKQKTGEGACPFNSLYWNFIDRHQGLLKSNMRMQIPLANWNKTNIQTKIEVLEQAATYLKNIDSL
jgi:deoxyribodipyrimidine photolyase-related protein